MSNELATYTINVAKTTSNITSDWNFDTHYCSSFCNHWYYPYTWSSPVTIYKYQVKCPKCKTNNWLELDKVTPCSKCDSTLKAVSKSVDYEVEVGQ